jgi:hypothetical protein
MPAVPQPNVAGAMQGAQPWPAQQPDVGGAAERAQPPLLSVPVPSLFLVAPQDHAKSLGGAPPPFAHLNTLSAPYGMPPYASCPSGWQMSGQPVWVPMQSLPMQEYHQVHFQRHPPVYQPSPVQQHQHQQQQQQQQQQQLMMMMAPHFAHHHQTVAPGRFKATKGFCNKCGSLKRGFGMGYCTNRPCRIASAAYARMW